MKVSGNKGKNISAYLMDGDATGCMKATIANWTCVAYRIPRTSLDLCKDRDDLKQSGVYFLFGVDDQSGDNVVYIGQAGARKNGEGILNRLAEHKRNPDKDYWTEAVVFTTSNNSFGPTEISYLENRFCGMAQNAKRYTVKNGNDPTHGTLSDQDFTLFAAYFDENKNGVKAFSSDSVKQYYLEGRRPAYSNNSELLRQLARKGYIMDTNAPEGAKSGKYYMLTDDGIAYIEAYVLKENAEEKKKARPRAKKSGLKVSETYVAINADVLNAKKYPSIKTLSGPKEQVIMAMYIVTNEGKGEWFTVDDVIHLLVNIF